MFAHYAYNANAIGLGGVFTSPKRKIVPSLASVALAPTGGEGTSLVTNYNEDGIAFDRAETRVWGSSRNGRIFSTRADVWVTNLDLLGLLQVDSMWASVTTVREVLMNGEILDRRFTFQAEILGLNAEGQSHDSPIDATIFDDNPSYESFIETLAAPERSNFRGMIGMSDDEATELVRSFKSKPNAEMTPPTIRCSLLRKPVLGGTSLNVKGIGRVHLAEALVKPGRRRLSLLRIDLDTTSDEPLNFPLQPITKGTTFLAKGGGDGDGSGSMTIGSVEGNGTTSVP